MKNLYALANLCGKYCGGLEILPITFIIITQVPFTNLDKDSVLLIPFSACFDGIIQNRNFPNYYLHSLPNNNSTITDRNNSIMQVIFSFELA